jgi:signal transduction histidine kinase
MKIDSLHALLRLARPNSERAAALLNAIGLEYYEGTGDEPDSALKYARRGFDMAQMLHDKRGMASALDVIANTLIDADKSETATKYFFQELSIGEEIADSLVIARSCFGVGYASGHQRQSDARENAFALELLRRAARIAELRNDNALRFKCYNAIGRVYRKMDDFVAALPYHEQAFTLAAQAGDDGFAGWAAYSIGTCFLRQRRFDSAMHYAELSLRLRQRIEYRLGISISLSFISEIYEQMGNTAEALRSARRSLDTATAANMRHAAVEACNRLSIIYDKLGKKDSAFTYYKRAAQMYDSIMAEEMHTNILALRSEMEVERKDQENKVLAREAAWKETIIKRQTFTTVMAVGCAAAMIALMMMLLRSNRLVRGQYKRLGTANAEITRQQELLKVQALEIGSMNAELTHANEDLHRANAQLARTVSEVDAANKALKQADEMRLVMLSTVSHDLKNPLNSLIGYIDLLQLDPDRADEYSEEIRHVAWRMLDLIQDLLDNFAYEVGKLNLRCDAVDMTALIGRTLTELQHHATLKQQRLMWSGGEPCTMQGDANRLRQVVENVCSNAIKYSPKGAQIRIAITHDSERVQALCRRAPSSVAALFPANALVFSVQDEGPGFTAEDKEQMFGLFQRLSAQPTGGESSHGIGLAIVKQIVELHGGCIWVESKPEGEFGSGVAGSTFYIALPMEQQSITDATNEITKVTSRTAS